MSDPNYTDPRLGPPPLRESNPRDPRLTELEASNAMWGWIAGGVVLALLLLFIFGRAPTNQSEGMASNDPNPPASTTLAPPRQQSSAPTVNSTNRMPPATTGQGSSGQQ